MKIKKFKDALPLNRLVFYLLVLGFLPVLFTSLHCYCAKKIWDRASDELLMVQHLAESKARKQHFNTIVKNAHKEAEQFYLENHLESLNFLRKERESLTQLLQSPAFTGNEGAEKRYAHITSKANRLQWVQGSVQSRGGIQEASCLLSHPVEIDTHDLKEILHRVEGNRKGKPQLIVTDFKLNRKSHTNGNEVFELNMKLLKREF